jgi:hypothetical protein
MLSGGWDVTLDVAVGLIDGIPQQATNVKAQKDSGLYKVSEVEKQKELQCSTLMNQINRVVTGKLLFFFFFYSNITFAFMVFYVMLFRFTCH